jgi:NADPH:quinone reductase-like Zn-dependent oxidoreductase
MQSPDQGSPGRTRILARLAGTGQLTPLIDRSYPLEQTAEAHAYVEQKHKKGNVVIVVD